MFYPNIPDHHMLAFTHLIRSETGYQGLIRHGVLTWRCDQTPQMFPQKVLWKIHLEKAKKEKFSNLVLFMEEIRQISWYTSQVVQDFFQLHLGFLHHQNSSFSPRNPIRWIHRQCITGVLEATIESFVLRKNEIGYRRPTFHSSMAMFITSVTCWKKKHCQRMPTPIPSKRSRNFI